MNQKKVHAQILEHAKTLVVLNNEITETAKSKTTNPAAWHTACDNFKAQYNRLAFPGGLEEGLIALKAHNTNAIMLAIEFLKADPYYHRASYNKQKIAHLLKTAPLTKTQVSELQKILLNSIKNKQFFCLEYARLARQIQDVEFKTEIEAIIEQPSDEYKIDNAKKMLLTMNS